MLQYRESGWPHEVIWKGGKLIIVAWDCGKGKLLGLEGSGGGGGSLLNLGCLVSLSSLLPSCCSCSSRRRRRDDGGCVRSISTSGDSVRGAGSLRSCSWTTACDCTSSSLGPAIPKVSARRSAILKVKVSNVLQSAKCTITKRQQLKLTIIHRCIVCKMNPY
jgi:hypothetical protein